MIGCVVLFLVVVTFFYYLEVHLVCQWFLILSGAFVCCDILAILNLKF